MSFKENNIHIMDNCFPKVKTLKLDISEILFKFSLVYLICIFSSLHYLAINLHILLN